MRELWDLSEVVERMAVAMWKHEAEKAQGWTTAQGRTIEAFRSQASQFQEKWRDLASAALEELIDGGFRPSDKRT